MKPILLLFVCIMQAFAGASQIKRSAKKPVKKQTLKSYQKLNSLCSLLADAPEKVHAVMVGISTYKYGGVYINNLSTCHNDATQLDKFLLTESNHQNKTGWVDLLINEKATEENIAHSLSPNDIALFFFSGHGAPQGITHYNTDDKDLMEYEGIKAMLRACPAKQKIIILDACHAGSSTTALYMGIVGDIIRNGGANKGMCFISSSQANESSQEYAEQKMGYFTYYFMEALRGLGDSNKDGCIGIVEAFNYTKNMVSIMTNGAQNPTLTGDIPTNLVLFTK
jgi:hypothetical protein